MKTYKKIHIHEKRENLAIYLCSTNWSKTCKEAKTKFLEKYPQFKDKQIYANFAKD